MAEECLRLAIASDNRHALAYNNLGVIEIRNGNVTAARTYFHAAANIASYVYEAHFNSAHLAYEVIISLINFYYICRVILHIRRLETYRRAISQCKSRCKRIPDITIVKLFCRNCKDISRIYETSNEKDISYFKLDCFI